MKKLTFLLATLAATNLLNAQTMAEESPKTGTIDVTGTAKMEMQPDFAEVRIVVETTANSAKDAQQSTMEKMRDVLEYLKSQSFVREVGTEGIRLSRNYRNDGKGFAGQQSVRFEITDINRWDEVAVALLERGVNDIRNIQFKSSQAEKMQEKLLAQAVENARQKASLLASQTGRQVGRALHISDKMSSGPRPMEYAQADGLMASSRSSVEAGNITLAAVVNVIFELK